MPRVAVYARLSRDTDESTSIERQLSACEREAERRGWDVVLRESDVDVSATKRRLDRPGLDAVRAAYSTLDAVLFYRVDRLARSISDFAQLVDEAEQARVALVSATEPIDLSTPMGRAMAQVIAVFAELEASTIGARVRSSVTHLKQVGRHAGGAAPFGMRAIANPGGAGKVLAPDPVEAPLVREAVERVLAGESLYSVARDWTARGVPARRAAAWSIGPLRRVVTNPRIAGLNVHNGETVRGEDGLPAQLWDGIVSPAELRAVEAAIAGRVATPTGRRWDSEHLLAGLLACDLCGRPLYARTATDKAGFTRRVYECKAKSSGRSDCAGVSVARAHLEAYVAERFLARFGRWAVERVVHVEAAGDASALEAVKASLVDLEADRYERGLFAGARGAERFAALYARLEARLTALELAERPAESRRESTGETFGQAWERAGVVERRELLASAIASVVVAKGTPGRRGFDAGRVVIYGSDGAPWAAV